MSADVGGQIRTIRKIRKMTVRQLAEAAAISVSLMEKIESGSRVPQSALVVALARALRVGTDRLYGQPYMNGAEADDGVQGVIPDLRRVLLTYDSPDDLVTAPRPLDALVAETRQVARMRQDGQYVPMGPLLPGLLMELTHRALSSSGPERQRAFWWLATGYRATNSLAHKLGYHDLSLTAVERVHWAADRSGDPLMQTSAAYLKGGAMLRMGAYTSARRLLEGLADAVERLAPEGALSDEALAVQGAILLKLAILEARDRRPERAHDRLSEAHACADLLGADSVHYEMSFGPTNVRIHWVAALIDSGDADQALARLGEWGASQGRAEWELPVPLAGERASHHHIDVAAARLATGDARGAFGSLQAARRIAPNHARNHPTLRATAATLARVDRTSGEEVAAFARWAGITR
ncbi:helix-turn-helix transcriptional regulator [Actinomadura sp. NEAU-AAG7]|uniref:helix-turn-helix domain-containing protein n=1 Tax=Actinomadura sp. NEAU-AAG7 TaxID=2839640 RepID=UPI001BE453F9|nr:helix-turn-helix transcriptional regulator [Actinomadura sp. NEAU-AAG7]MBT2207815.1 helix-turn-helix domain-containing protein [Actinomadura sp. NEAU-AAG7]